jgi:hypothetical protein
MSRRNENSMITSSTLLGLAIALTAGQPSSVRGDSANDGKTIAFNRDIRPILADKCFKCHGPDAKERKAKLRLDNARDALVPAASGSRAIVPRKIDESELYLRITSDDPEERMPPASTGKSLSAVEVARLKTWIQEGA